MIREAMAESLDRHRGRTAVVGASDVLSYEDQVNAGRILGPRIYSTGPGVFSSENIRDLDHARKILKRYAEYYDTKTLKQYVAGNREQRQWVIQAANELKLMPTTEGSLDIRMNVTELIDGYSGHEHTIPTFPLQSDLIRMMALGPLDLLLYRPILMWAGLRGTWQFLRKEKGWDKFERNQREAQPVAAYAS